MAEKPLTENTFELVILTPDKCFFSGQVREVIFDTPEGEIGIMAGHMPIIAAVAEGMIDIFIDDEEKTAAVSQGFAEIHGNEAEFFVDSVEWEDDIDAARAAEALERAALRLKADVSLQEHVRAKAAMARAMARLKVVQMHHK